MSARNLTCRRRWTWKNGKKCPGTSYLRLPLVVQNETATKKIKTMNITIWVISQNQQLTLEHFPYKEHVQLVEARSSRTIACHILWHPNGIPHAARFYEENQCANASRSNNQSRLTCLDSLLTRRCASNIVFAAHHTILVHSRIPQPSLTHSIPLQTAVTSL